MDAQGYTKNGELSGQQMGNETWYDAMTRFLNYWLCNWTFIEADFEDIADETKSEV